jgi:hypothetical protein
VTDRIDFGGKPWKAIPHETLRDPDLSLVARGALCTILSHQDGWVRSCIALLQRESTCGRMQARNAMKELCALGYAKLEQTRGPGGRFQTAYTVYAIRQETGVESGDSPGADEPPTVERGAAHLSAVGEALEVEALDEEPETKVLAPRPRNEVFEILFLLEAGLEYSIENNETLTPTSRGALNKAAAEIKGTGISPDELMAAIQAWPSVMGDATCTANAVNKHLPRLRAAARGNVARSHAPTDFDRTMAELERRRQA